MSRYLLVSTLVTTVSLFVWQSISNTVIPWHSAPMRELSPAAVAAVHGVLPANGMYFGKAGMLAIINVAADLHDRTGEMGVPLARQLAIDAVMALLLAFAVARLRRRPAAATGATLALVAAAIATCLAVSDWNWYGYPFAFALSNVADATVQGFLAGLVLAWAMRRFAPAEARPAEPVVFAAG